MNLHEAMTRRVSRRAYLNDPIPAKKLQILSDWVAAYNQESGLSMELIPDGSAAFGGLRRSYGMFTGVKTLIALKGRADDPHLKEKAGYYGELMVLEAVKQGLGTCWVGGSFDKSNPLFSLKEGEAFVCVITLGLTPLLKTAREKVIYAMSHGRSKPIEQMYEAEGTPPAWFMQGVRAVMLAPSAVNAQPVKLYYKSRVVTAAVKDEGAARLIDLGIAKAHFALAAGGRFDWGNGGKFTKG